MQTSLTEKKQELRETIRTVVMAVLLAMTFRSFAYEPFHIPSSSMKANLQIGDYLFVSKFSYGYSRFSFPFGLPLFSGRIMETTPKRGDVIVFRKPNDTSIDFIKRLIGLPGDRIQVKHGVLFINDQEVPRTRIEDYQEFDEETNTMVRIARYEETLPEGKKIEVLDDVEDGPADNTPVFRVPAGHYFMMGDNRDHSADSRFFDVVGFVPEKNLVGRAEMILLSAKGGWSLRTERFFRGIN